MSSPSVRPLQIREAGGVPQCAPLPAFCTQNPSLFPGARPPAGPGVAVTAGHHEPTVAFSWPAMGPHSSMQHNAAAVQERIWLCN